ncbi:hypothetical protein ENBRE01_1838 [Enteropsectra breve]|nr:hypothetical protein ENBRE01_1838 [Enteropsectra breve]
MCLEGLIETIFSLNTKAAMHQSVKKFSGEKKDDAGDFLEKIEPYKIEWREEYQSMIMNHLRGKVLVSAGGWDRFSHLFNKKGKFLFFPLKKGYRKDQLMQLYESALDAASKACPSCGKVVKLCKGSNHILRCHKKWCQARWSQLEGTPFSHTKLPTITLLRFCRCG